MSLWPHQVRAFEETKAAIKSGRRWNCVVIPTGGGKTYFASHCVMQHVSVGGRVLWLAHRDELVAQAADSLERSGLSVGCITSKGIRVTNPYRPVQVASIQTLVARGVRPEATLVVADECHHLTEGNGWTEVAKYYRTKSLGIGLTATPCRADGRGLEELFDNLIVGATPKELIDAGHLVPCEVLSPSAPLEAGQIAQKPADAYLENTPGEKAVVFAAHLKAARQFADEFTEAGVPCAIVSGSMKRDERARVLAAHKAGRIRVLVNVGVLTEGYDDTGISVCILARSCGSVSLYLQMVGRALRAHPGKTRAVLLDLHGTSRVYGTPDEDREYSLEGKAIRRKLEMATERFCLVCGVLLEGDCAVCPDCGLKRPELAVPFVVGVKLVKFAAKRRESEDKRLETLRRWIAAAVAKGHKPGSAWFKFKAVYGVEPTSEMWKCANNP